MNQTFNFFLTFFLSLYVLELNVERYHVQHWGGEHSCNGYYRNSVCVFSIRDVGTILASGRMIANKARTDYDPVLSPCVADFVERRRGEGAEAPVTTYNEVLLCEDQKHNVGGGWGSFLEGGNFEKHVQIGKIAAENVTSVPFTS